MSPLADLQVLENFGSKYRQVSVVTSIEVIEIFSSGVDQIKAALKVTKMIIQASAANR